VNLTLRDICSEGGLIQTGPFGSQLHASDYVPDGVPVVMPTNIGANKIVEQGIARVSEEMAHTMGRHRLRSGDIVYSRRGDITRRALVRHEVGWLCGTGCLLVRPGAGTDSTWLSYWLGTPETHGWLLQHSVGATMPNLNTGILSALPVSLPPLDEQRRIAEVLGALDDLIDTSERLKVRLDQAARASFLRAWDGESWIKIAELGEVIMGQSPPGDTYGDAPVGLPFHQGVRDFGERFPRNRIYCTAPTRIAQRGDILIAVRAPVGEVNVASQELAIGRGLAALRARQPSTAFQAIRAFESTWAAHQGTGTVFSSINGADLRGAKVPKVDDGAVESALAEFDAAFTALYAENETLRRTRDELLPLLMSGKVRVRPEGVSA
jgi:type I restriction enzyme S subunit